MPKMRILVAGPGAVGGFVAARLAEAGQDVTVLARPRRAARLREDGLQLTGAGVAGGTHTVRVPVLTAAELAPGYRRQHRGGHVADARPGGRHRRRSRG